MNSGRRSWVLGAGVAAAATLAGAGWALWRQRSSGSTADDLALWQQSFETPSGGRLAMADLHGRPLVLNFWATWCPPCVREMPTLDRFQREFGPRGWRVVGLAVDQLPAVREFLARTPVSFDIGMAGFGGIDLSRRLGNLAGGLPFTVVYGRDGSVRQRQIGETTQELLLQWATSAD